MHVYSIYCFHFYLKIFLAAGTQKYNTAHKGLRGFPLCSKVGGLGLWLSLRDGFHSPGLPGDMDNGAGTELLFQMSPRLRQGHRAAGSRGRIRGGPMTWATRCVRPKFMLES